MMQRDAFEVSAKKDTVHTTLKNKLDDLNRMSHDTLSLNITGWADRRHSSNQEDDPSICNSIVTGHRNSDTRQDRWTRIFSLQLITLSLLVTKVTTEINCTNGISTLGYTWPRGEIVIQHGNPLHILCTLNETYINATYPGKNASDIQFRTDKGLLSPYVTIVNRTTASLNILQPQGSKRTVYCELRLKEDYESNDRVEICKNTVIVGYPPNRPNLNCTSYNWERLECKWSVTPNFVETHYSLQFFSVHGRPLTPAMPCDNTTLLVPCIWEKNTDYQSSRNHVLAMHGENVFGSRDFMYKRNHYAHVIPDPPQMLEALNPTTQTVLLQWVVPDNMKDFPAGFHHRILYHSQYDDENLWKVINITDDIHLTMRIYRIDDLLYPNAKYDVLVYLKSAEAIGEEMWSAFTSTQFHTLPTLPSAPPRVIDGSYCIVQSTYDRDLYLYWKPIAKFEENGDHFRYEISYMEDDIRTILKPQELTGVSAKFARLSPNSYDLEITSTNIVGANYTRTANIYIPQEDSRLCEPMEFKVTKYEEAVYLLDWLPPIQIEEMETVFTNYTIVWCQNDSENPILCTSDLNWIIVSNKSTSTTVTVSKPFGAYQFAIAANDNTGSSGMVWTSTFTNSAREGDKIEGNSFVARYLRASSYNSQTIELTWKQVCSDQIENYRIYYCPVHSPRNLTCKGASLNFKIKGPMKWYTLIHSLMPYTLYAMQITVLTKYGEGPFSNIVYNTTRQDAPYTPPRNLQAIHVTNTTALISWQPPRIANGIITYYEVYYNNLVEVVKKGTRVTLLKLSPYKMYHVSVVACTVLCSREFSMLEITTGVGVPSKIDMPMVHKCHLKGCTDETLFVSWNPPREPAGIVVYELWHEGKIYKTPNIGMKINITSCDLHPQKTTHKFRVRAYNVDFENHSLVGPWSDVKEAYCTKYSEIDKNHVYTDYDEEVANS